MFHTPPRPRCDVSSMIILKNAFKLIDIVESYTNSKTVEQKAMFTIYKVLSKTHVHTLQQFDCQIVAKCEHEFYSTLYKV